MKMNPRRFLFQGDSITDGNRGRTEDPNHIMGHSYAFSIASRLMADFPERKLEFFNRGVSGDSHVEMEKRWQTDCLDIAPDVLSILIGTNGSRQGCCCYAPWDADHPDGPDPAQLPIRFGIEDTATLNKLPDAAIIRLNIGIATTNRRHVVVRKTDYMGIRAFVKLGLNANMDMTLTEEPLPIPFINK